MSTKERLSASVDAQLLAAGHAAVAAGRAESLSAWVNDALQMKTAHDQRMVALDEFLATYEADHGEVTQKEINDAARRARGGAVVVRGSTDNRPVSQ